MEWNGILLLGDLGQEQEGVAVVALDVFRQGDVALQGFGGAMTFDRARNIRRLAASLPAESLVLETDAPDISPAWVHPGRNQPAELARIAQVLAELRGLSLEAVAELTTANAARVLPALRLTGAGAPANIGSD